MLQSLLLCNNYNQRLFSQPSMADDVFSDVTIDSCYEEMYSYFTKLQYRKGNQIVQVFSDVEFELSSFNFSCENFVMEICK